MIFFYLSCAPSSFETHAWVTEVEGSTYFNSNLTNPKQFISFEDGLLVVDSGSDSLLYVTEEDVEERVSDLDNPTELINTVPPTIATSTSIYHYLSEDNRLTAIIEDRIDPTNIVSHNDTLFWIEEEQVWSYNNGDVNVISEDLDSPYDLISWNDGLWIATQADNAIWQYDGTELTKMATLDDIPHRFAIGNDGLWITTRSFRWPFGGWIVFFDGNNATKITQSPPEPEHIQSWEDAVIWSSKQSITIYQDDPYDILSIQTTVSSMLVQDDSLFWSDHQGGRIGEISLNTLVP